MKKTTIELVTLSNNFYLARGGERDVYIHPYDNSKVIKIVFVKGKHNNQNELDYQYAQYLKKKNVDFSHITKCYGWINTNLGKGLIFERIENYDKTQIRSFSYYTKHNILNKKVASKLLSQLKKYLFTNNILFIDASLSNIFCQKISNNKFKLIIFDGLGARRTGVKFMLYMYSKLLTKYKIKKQWKLFLKNYNYQRSLKIKL